MKRDTVFFAFLSISIHLSDNNSFLENDIDFYNSVPFLKRTSRPEPSSVINFTPGTYFVEFLQVRERGSEMMWIMGGGNKKKQYYIK
jgi:hypothetical protein